MQNAIAFSDNDVATIAWSYGKQPVDNDENLVIIEGNKKLAAAYATHILDVYDHFSWRYTVKRLKGQRPRTSRSRASPRNGSRSTSTPTARSAPRNSSSG
jgi:hypothetical protein